MQCSAIQTQVLCKYKRTVFCGTNWKGFGRKLFWSNWRATPLKDYGKPQKKKNTIRIDSIPDAKSHSPAHKSSAYKTLLESYFIFNGSVEYEVTFKKCFVFMNHLKMATDRGRNMFLESYFIFNGSVEYEVTFKKCFVFMNYLKMATDRGRNIECR
jgi:hypothetical protein